MFKPQGQKEFLIKDRGGAIFKIKTHAVPYRVMAAAHAVKEVNGELLKDRYENTVWPDPETVAFATPVKSGMHVVGYKNDEAELLVPVGRFGSAAH